MPVSTRRSVLNQAKQVLASDCWCDPDDFEQDTSVATLTIISDGRRRYAHQSDPFFVTFGHGVVATSTEEHIDWLERFLQGKSR